MKVFKDLLKKTENLEIDLELAEQESLKNDLLSAVVVMSESDLNELIIFNRTILRPAFKTYASLEEKREKLMSVIRELDERSVQSIITQMKRLKS